MLFVAAPVIFGFFALVIDGGLYFVKERVAQNAADAAALAGAQDLCPLETDAKRSACEDKAIATAIRVCGYQLA